MITMVTGIPVVEGGIAAGEEEGGIIGGITITGTTEDAVEVEAVVVAVITVVEVVVEVEAGIMEVVVGEEAVINHLVFTEPAVLILTNMAPTRPDTEDQIIITNKQILNNRNMIFIFPSKVEW